MQVFGIQRTRVEVCGAYPLLSMQYTVIHRPGKANGNAVTLPHASQQTGLLKEREAVWKTGFPFRRVNSSVPIELELQLSMQAL